MPPCVHPVVYPACLPCTPCGIPTQHASLCTRVYTSLCMPPCVPGGITPLYMPPFLPWWVYTPCICLPFSHGGYPSLYMPPFLSFVGGNEVQRALYTAAPRRPTRFTVGQYLSDAVFWSRMRERERTTLRLERVSRETLPVSLLVDNPLFGREIPTLGYPPWYTLVCPPPCTLGYMPPPSTGCT